MTLSATVRRAGPFSGNGVTTVFPFTFRVFASTDLLVNRTTAGVTTALVLTTDYSVVLNPDQAASPGGSITLAAALAVGSTLVAVGNLPYDQPLDLPSGGNFSPGAQENAFDRAVMQIQQLKDSADSSLRVPLGETVNPFPAAAARANYYSGFDGAGQPTLLLAAAGTAAALASDLANATDVLKGDALIGVRLNATGSTARTQHAKNADSVHLFDFMTTAQADDWTSRALALDLAVPLQAFIDACSSGTENAAPAGILPSGAGRTTVTLVFKSRFVTIRGAGMWKSQIFFNGVAGGCFTTNAIIYLSPVLSDFAISGDTASGKGFDLSQITGEVFNGVFERIRIIAGGDGLYAPKFFSMKVDGVVSSSINGHAFRVSCGPAVAWVNCYAVLAGAGKAGYRLRGAIHMVSCNGVDSAPYWGVFGQDTAAADGFQNDFPGAGHDYPDVQLIGCNVENFTTGGIVVHQSYRSFHMLGGKFDRAGLATSYHSYVRARRSGVSGNNPLRFDVGTIFTGGGSPTAANLYTDEQARFEDENGELATVFTTWTSLVVGAAVPIITRTTLQDVQQDAAVGFSAISPRRLSVKMIRYDTPAALTPVGAAQNIVVTGYTRVTVTPGAAASISTATFVATIGAGLDYDRNGDLLIEAGNANLTVNHTALGGAVNTFVMSGGANLALGTGRVVRFCRSVTTSQWIQLG